MNNEQISKILKRCERTRPFFLGCYPSDVIPISDRYPYAVIMNTDKASRPGEHWTAMFVESERLVEYFDSYGDIPNVNIGSYLEEFPLCKRSTFPLQSVFTKVCGQFCITFVVLRCSGMSFEDIVSFLGKHKNPDKFVYDFVRRLVS